MIKLIITKLLSFSLIGFLAITVVPVAFSLIATLLPFALVGALIWGGYRLLQRLFGFEPAPAPVFSLPTVKGARQETPVPTSIPTPDPILQELSLPLIEEPAQRSRFRHYGRVFLEILCGGLVGGMVGGAIGFNTPGFTQVLLAGVLAGLAAGYTVGSAQTQPARSCC